MLHPKTTAIIHKNVKIITNISELTYEMIIIPDEKPERAKQKSNIFCPIKLQTFIMILNLSRIKIQKECYMYMAKEDMREKLVCQALIVRNEV